MSEAKKPETAAAVPVPPNPEAEATARVNELQDKLKALETEVKILEGRFANRDPLKFKDVAKENELLRARQVRLRKALFLLLSQSLNPQTPDDHKLRTEALRRAAVELCKKKNVAPELWKNIES